jgi:hypothetical protein
MSTNASSHSRAARGAPAPGEASTRTPETEASYLRRALAFEAHTATQLSIVNPSPMVVAAHALERRQEWAKSTWRQFKAALLFRYQAMGTPEALEAASLLRDGHQGPCAKKTRRTSGRRAKTVTPADLQDVIKRVQSSSSQYAPLLSTWLLLGAEVGLRPHEWAQAELVYAPPAAVGDDEHDSSAPLPYLRIHNSKVTNGRSHGELRHLNLSRLSAELVSAVGQFAKVMSGIASRGEYQRCYGACTKLLYRINRELHRNDEKRWVQLYSSRHRFSAEAKHQLGADGVAALLGHGTTKTAARHYGRRITATGSLGPKPVAAEVARVRKVRGYQSRQIGTSVAHELQGPVPAPKK